MQDKTKKILIKTGKVLGWIIGSILVLLLVLIAVIQIPAVQQKITQEAVSFLEKKVGTPVRIESLYIAFPKNIVMKGLYLEDKSKDTLLYAGRLSINTDLWALTQNEIQLNEIALENTVAKITRVEGDSAFNFSYIVEAFAGDSTAVPDTLEQKGWNFVAKTLTLDAVRASYKDGLSGNYMDVTIGQFEVEMNKFDLEKSIFGIETISLENTIANVIQTKLPSAEQTEEELEPDSASLDLNLQALTLKNVKARYNQEATGQTVRLEIGESEFTANKIDLVNKVIDVDNFSLARTFLSYQQSKNNPRKETASSASQNNGPQSINDNVSTQSNWNIRLNTFSLDGNSIQYYDLTKSHEPESMDFDHLWITNLNASAEDFSYAGADINGIVNNFSFTEKSGFTLKQLNTSIKVTEDSAYLDDFTIETGHSKINLDAQASYASFKDLPSNYKETKLYADMTNSHIGVGDLLYVSPNLLDSLPVKLNSQSRIYLDASVFGELNNLTLHHFTIKALSDTYVNMKGKIAGLPDMSKVSLDMNLEKLYTTKRDLHALLADTLLPDSIAPPEWVNVNAKYKGNFEKAEFKTMVTSSLGGADVNGKMNLDSASTTRGFSAQASINEFNLGELLMQPQTIGKLNLQAALNSECLTRAEMNSALEATVSSFEYKNYRYENLKLNAKVKNDIVEGWASMKDNNLEFIVNGNANFQEEAPHYNVSLDLRNVDLKGLNLALRPLKFRGTLDVNMSTPDMRSLNGQVGIRKVAVFNGDKLYSVDSLLFASIDQEGRSEINIESDIMNGYFKGSINIFQMGAVMREYFNTYYSLHDSIERSYEDPQHFSFNLDLKRTDLITDILLPELSSFVPGKITGEFDSKAKNLNLKFDLTEIQYANIGVKSFVLNTNSDSARLNYNLFIDKILIDSMKIDGVEFNGTVAHDSIRTNLFILDSLNKTKYLFGGTFFSLDKEFELKLNPDQVMLNYVRWAIPEDNYLRFGGPKLVAQNVSLSNGREKIILESKPEPGTPMSIGFREVNLEYLVSMIAQHKPLSGLLQGNINVYPSKTSTNFTSDLTITDFNLAEIPWGDIKLAVKQTVKDRFDVDFSIIGQHNDIRAFGNYTGGEMPGLTIETNIRRFDLTSIAPLIETQLKDLKGNLTGTMNITGSPAKPSVIGDVSFNNTSFFSTYLNSSYTINNETISLTRQGISFDKFELVDLNKNTAHLDGLITTSDYRDFKFKLDLDANGFRVLNTTKTDNDLFYGQVDLNISARIRGDITTPSIQTSISLSGGNHLTYIVPQSEAAVLAAQGIVRFVDKTFKADPFIKKIQPELNDTIKSQFTGMDVTANIELTDKESLTIVIDPTTNDQLTVKGNTTLTLQMDRTGDMQLAGRYEISEGTYNLSFYKFLKREFKIEKGSTITWSGDPLNAEMDIRAIFELEAAPIDLMINQLAGSSDQAALNRYKQRLPFQVYLNLKGQLLNPEISFKLEMPMDERNALEGNIYARLQDINTRESDLNKQVFALLILKRFISDNPFETEAGGGIEGSARSSVSKILTEQLNRLSENVKGVELSFDVKSYEDYNSGQAEGQTELQLGLSKSLLNDRLVVKLSGNVDIEGENTNREVTDYIGDLALEYLLTEDGRFRITGFRNSNYDMIDGELIETGAGLIYIKDYDTLRELFKANAKDK